MIGRRPQRALHVACLITYPISLVPNAASTSTVDTAPQAVLHEDAHVEGGLGFTNKELLASQRRQDLIPHRLHILAYHELTASAGS